MQDFLLSEDKEQFRRIVVFRALKLGDSLCAVPAFRALRGLLPKAAITWIGLPWALPLAERLGAYVDEFVEFPGFPGLPERAAEPHVVAQFLVAMQERRFDLAIQLHGSGLVTNPLVALFGARRAAGYYLAGNFCPDPEGFILYPEGEHEIRRNIDLMAHLGADSIGEHMEFPVTAGDFSELDTALCESQLAGDYVCLHPGASARERRWPAEHFATVADALAHDGFQVVLTGTRAEAALTAAVARAMTAPALDLAPLDLSLGALAALLVKARLVVANDTGVSHLASALAVPSVTVFNQLGLLPRWAPLEPTRHAVVSGQLPTSADLAIQRSRDLLGRSQSLSQAAVARGSRVTFAKRQDQGDGSRWAL